MRIFLTGATGFIGSALIPELLAAGHHVLGLTRSEEGARSLLAAGAEPHPGSLEDVDSLRRGAAQTDGVIHAGFDHDFSNFLASCDKDRRAIAALGAALAGSDRPLLITSGVGLGSSATGGPAREDLFDRTHANPRIASELAGAEVLEAGVNLSVMRLPQVHDTRKQGLVTFLIAKARETGVSAYVGEGLNRLSAGHVTDVVRLYRLALERGEAGARYHAVAEGGVPVRTIAEAIGRGLNLPVRSLTPEEAPGHFGWLAMFADMDLWASSDWTRRTLDWRPTGPGLIADLDAMRHPADARQM